MTLLHDRTFMHEENFAKIKICAKTLLHEGKFLHEDTFLKGTFLHEDFSARRDVFECRKVFEKKGF